MALVLFPGAAKAAPVELDTQEAHIIVIRPVDEWSGDSSAQTDSLDQVRSRKANYRLMVGYKDEVHGGPLWLAKASNHPVVNAVREQLAAAGFTLGLSQKYFFVVELSQSMEPSSFKSLVEAQAIAYRLTILNEGDPETLGSRISGSKFAGGVLSLVTLGVAGAKFGSSGAQVVLNTGLAGDFYQIPLGVPDALAPAALPALDAGEYKEMEVRRVTYRGGMTGQIIVAYRNAKTAESEVAALSKAIAAVAGAGTTEDEVRKSRDADFEFRKATWKACVDTGECRDGKYVGKPN
jgi:hypothetical protein